VKKIRILLQDPVAQDLTSDCHWLAASVVKWAELVATDSDFPGSIPGTIRRSYLNEKEAASV
jgi:hypothetical protein